VLRDVIYVFPLCRKCIEPRESPYLFKGSYLALYIGIFKLYIIHDPCLNQMYTIMVYVCVHLLEPLLCACRYVWFTGSNL